MRIIFLGFLLPLAACGQEKVAPAAREPKAGAPHPVAAKDPQTAGIPGQCDFSGWSNDEDPKGLSLRAGPSMTARVIGTLPPPVEDVENGRTWRSGFDVVEAKGGWFRIEKAFVYTAHGGTRPLEAGTGWIQGGRLGFEAQGNVVFAAPDPASAPVVTEWYEGDTPKRITYRNPVACKGTWLKLDATGRDGKARTGWARGICGNQETSCDMPGDWIDERTLPRF